MNSFILRAVGNLARSPEVTAKGDVAYVRFCLVGTDHAEPDEEVDRSRDVATSLWFMAFDEIADKIVRGSHKGDQLIVEARVRPRIWVDKQGEKHCENVFIVTGFRFGAKRGPGAVAASALEPTPRNPAQPDTEALAIAS
jgi:single-stranded DNA-binding protein